MTRLLPMLLWAAAGCQPECGDGDVCLVAGSGDAGFNGEDLPATETWLYLPTDVLKHPDGRLVVVDYNNYRIRAIEADGAFTTLAGNGEHAYATEGAAARETSFENPIAAAFDADGALLIAAQHEGRVLRIPSGGVVEVVAGTGELGFSGDGGDALQARLFDPTGLALVDGAIYVSDSATNRVRVVADGVIDTVVGSEGGDPEGAGTEVLLDRPQRVSFDADRRRLLIADASNNRVCALDVDTGVVTEIAGTGQAGYAGDGGPALLATLDQPQAAVATADGTVLITDARNHVLRAVDPGGTITTVLGDGSAGFASIEPTRAAKAQLNYPAGLFVDGDDVYVTNMLAHQVIVWKGAL